MTMTMCEIIDGFRIALRAIGASGLTGSEAINAFATLHQLVGRLEGIEYANGYRAACESERQASAPAARPLVETIDPDEITDSMIDDAAAHAAVNRILTAAESEEEEDALDRLCDELDEELVPYTLPSRIASKY